MTAPAHRDDGSEMSIGKLAEAAGLTTATINFYVKQGVLPPPRKINRTRAAYGEHHLRLLTLIGRLKAGGLPLAVIGRLIQREMSTPGGLERLEDIGYFQALPPPPRARHAESIEPFEPMEREAFIAAHDVDREILELAERYGLVRARDHGFDHRDLWSYRNVETLVDDGLSPEQLEAVAGVVDFSRKIAPVVLSQLRQRGPHSGQGRVRYRDLVAPYMALQAYVLDRVQDEMFPDWRAKLFGDDDEAPPSD